jgi:subtilisin-like proprotein convertase family protein
MRKHALAPRHGRGRTYNLDLLEPRRLLASITGTVYHDLDGDGALDAADDVGQANWRVFLDANGNGRLDPFENTVLTDAAGAYAFGGLATGTHAVREIVQPGWLRTGPSVTTGGDGGHTVTLTSANPDATGRNFFNARPGTIKGLKYHDFDGDGTREFGEDPLLGWDIYLDTNDNLIRDTRMFNHATGPALPIADAATVSSTVTANHPGMFGRVLDVNVTLDISHAQDDQLDVYLISPSGTRVRLFDDVGGAGDDFAGTTLDDEAVVAITAGAAPFAGNYRPEEPLAAFDHEKPNGQWRLEVTDDTAGVTGTLNSWSLRLIAGDPLRTTAADGVYFFPNLPPATYTVREVMQSNWMRTFPATGSTHVVQLNSGGNIVGRNFLNCSFAQFYGTKWNDVNGDGDHFDVGENSMDGWAIYLDIDNDRAFDEATVSAPASLDVPKTIADFGTVASQVLVAGLSGRILDVNVGLDITHTNDEHLKVYLIAPTGVEVELFSDVGGAGDNFINTVLDDEAIVAIDAGAAPFNGTYRPEQELSLLDNQIPNGLWRLRVTDDTGVAGLTDGRVNAWSLQITMGEPSRISSPDYAFDRLPPDAYFVREVMQPGWRCTWPFVGFHELHLTSGAAFGGVDFLNTQRPPIVGRRFPYLDPYVLFGAQQANAADEEIGMAPAQGAAFDVLPATM